MALRDHRSRRNGEQHRKEEYKLTRFYTALKENGQNDQIQNVLTSTLCGCLKIENKNILAILNLTSSSHMTVYLLGCYLNVFLQQLNTLAELRAKTNLGDHPELNFIESS